MRVFAFALATSAALAAMAPAIALAAAPVAPPPPRAASLNLCTDELLLALARPGQAASITHLSRSRAEVPWWRAAQNVPANDGSLLSVAALRPDVVLTMGGGARDRAAIARRLGMRVIDLPFPQSIADVKASIARVAAALERPGAGAALTGRIADLERTRPARAIDALWLSGGGQTLPAAGLGAQWMRLVGLRQRAMRGNRVSLEDMLLAPPQLLLRSDYRAGQYSSQQKWLSHPLANRTQGLPARRTDGRVWTCMGPSMIAEIERLRR